MKKWKAILEDNTHIEENPEKSNWLSIQSKVKQLEFDNNGQVIKLPPNMPEYIQGKTASADLISGKCQVESRFIGFIKDQFKLLVRIDEKTNCISIETECRH